MFIYNGCHPLGATSNMLITKMGITRGLLRDYLLNLGITGGLFGIWGMDYWPWFGLGKKYMWAESTCGCGIFLEGIYRGNVPIESNIWWAG